MNQNSTSGEIVSEMPLCIMVGLLRSICSPSIAALTQKEAPEHTVETTDLLLLVASLHDEFLHLIVGHTGAIHAINANDHIVREILWQSRPVTSIGTTSRSPPKQCLGHALEGEMVRRIQQLRFQPVGVGVGRDRLQNNVGVQVGYRPVGEVGPVSVAPSVVAYHPQLQVVPGAGGVEMVVAPSRRDAVLGAAEVQVVHRIGHVGNLDVRGGVSADDG